MKDKHAAQIASELGLAEDKVLAAMDLLDEDATIPFIARYRKEATGSMDEVAVTSVRDRMDALRELDKRRESIVKSLSERELLTDELARKLEAAATLRELADLYLPFRPKRRTRASIAREKGLEPLARFLMARQDDPGFDPQAEARSFAGTENGPADAAEALAGARDIIAETVSEDLKAREVIRGLFLKKAMVRSRAAGEANAESSKYSDYFDWEEPLNKIPSHRALALLRGEREKELLVRLAPPEDEALDALGRLFVTGKAPASSEVKRAVEDGYKRLLSSSIESEVRSELKKRSDAEAIEVFAGNLRELLLAPPLGARRVMALDPGFRAGCKLVCLDENGGFLHYETIFPHSGKGQEAKAGAAVKRLIESYGIQVIAVGNGTAGRETEAFLKSLGLARSIPILPVNESGASVYSASEEAREEFPDMDAMVRGAISIGRRLMDPLAELVKIDPKSIGVGQYQHDVDQAELKKCLDDVVISCVNQVGVDVNVAGKSLLGYVSGLGPQLAANLVAYRAEHGPFKNREQLKKVPRLGPKAFEQAAGFLRVRGGDAPLDSSAVHPESYPLVERMARDMKVKVESLMKSAELQARVELSQYFSREVGLPTLLDIMAELEKPGRDPREDFEIVQFAEGVEKIEDLSAGMKLNGVVTNVTRFGAFVDVGVHQDGLVHVSQLSDRFVKDPSDAVKVNQKVSVTVLEVDVKRKRIALSMKSNPKFKE